MIYGIRGAQTLVDFWMRLSTNSFLGEVGK